MVTGNCHSPTVLESFAAGSCADATVGAHIGQCAACRAAVEEARANNSLLAGVRRALEAHGGAGRAEGPAPVEPDLVSGYQIQEEIHRGGQGVVYRAVQTRTNRTVAIKMLLGGRGASGRQKERFEREVRIAAGLRHPNIVTVFDNGSISDGRYGLVMEYIEGVPLDRWSRTLDGARSRDARRRALRERLAVMVEVCDAVLYAHQHSIVHRDLKPANILVDAQGEPHILDFGIARDTGPLENTRLTNTGEFAGTLAYASPEQLSGDLSKVDTRTDIYSLGVIMYEMVSGKMPYAVDGPMSRIIRSIEADEPAALPRRTRDPSGPWVDGEVSTIILKAMSKDPARRYQTAAGLRDDLNRYLAGEAIEARRDSTWYILRKTAAKHRILVAAAGLIFVLLAGFGAAMAWQAHRLEVRSGELAGALSDSNVERGRMLAVTGNTLLAEQVIFGELTAAGVTRIDGPEAGFAGSPESLHAYWGLWDAFRYSSSVATLGAHDKAYTLLYFDQDGQRLCGVDATGNLVSWSVATWEPVRDTRLVTQIDGPETPGVHAALAPDGTIAIVGGGIVRVIDPETGVVKAQVDDPDDPAVFATFSPDGTLLATMASNDQLRLRDGRSLATLVTISGNPDASTVAGSYGRPEFSLDGSLIAAVRPDGSVGLWNTSSGVLERTLPPPESLANHIRGWGITSCTIAFGPDGTIAAGLGTHVVIWPAEGTAPVDLGSSGGAVRTLAFLPGSEGRLLVSGGAPPGGGDGVTIIWDLATGSRVATFKSTGSVGACAISPDGRLIAVGDLFGNVEVLENAREPHVRVLQSGAGRGAVAAVSPDGRVVAVTAVPDGESGWDVLLMDLKSGGTISRFHREGNPIVGLAFAPDGLTLFELEAKGGISQWDLPSGTAGREFSVADLTPGQPQTLIDPGSGVRMMRLSPDGGTLARGRIDGLIDLWDVPSGRWIDRLKTANAVWADIAFSPDSRTLVAHHQIGFMLWDVQTRQVKRTIEGDTANSLPVVAYAPDGALIAAAWGGRHIGFWDAGTGQFVRASNQPGTAGTAMAFHPSGSILFASAMDSSIRLWDTRTGQQLLSLEKHTELIHSLLVTPDGNTLISSDASGLVLVWDLAYYNDRIRRELAFYAAREAAYAAREAGK